MFTTLIFDMDGLMIDSETLYWRVEKQIAADYGKACPDELLQNMMGRSPMESIEIYCRALEVEMSPAQMLAYRDAKVAELLKTVDPMPGLMEILRQFRGRLKMAICTSAPRTFVDIVMGRLNLASFFSAIQTSEGIRRGKPDPEIYLSVMAKLGSKPSESIVLEDSCHGARAGKNAGAYTIAVPSIYTCNQDFSFADYRAADLKDAAKQIAGLLQ